MGRCLLLVFVSLTSVQAASAQQRWAEYTDARGTRIEYSQDIFSVREKSDVGQVLTTQDGRARIHMFWMDNPKALKPREFMRAHFRAPRSSLTYERVAGNFFALSTRREGMIVYLRCNFSQIRAATLHCVDIRYPQNEKIAWDDVVTRVSRSVRPLAAAR
jgi:hypothetical protein